MSELIEVCSPEESKRVIAKLGLDRRTMGFSLSGYIDAVCRDEKSGTVAWEIHQPNVITDYGRRSFSDLGFWSVYVFSSPSTDAASLARYTLLDSGTSNSSQTSTLLTPSYDSITLTKTWTNSFAAPASNRQIGAIGLCRTAKSTALGIYGIIAYALISPIKTQSTLQTLEVLYRVTLTPVY